MADIIPFPLDTITERDRDRLKEAASGTPFDITFREDKEGNVIAALIRCGHEAPSFRIEKRQGTWHAYSCDASGEPAVAEDRTAEALMKLLAVQDSSKVS